jgi:hypothetical protein
VPPKTPDSGGGSGSPGSAGLVAISGKGKAQVCPHFAANWTHRSMAILKQKIIKRLPQVRSDYQLFSTPRITLLLIKILEERINDFLREVILAST